VNSYNLAIGKGFATNQNVVLDAIGGIEIGDETGIGPNCVILAHEHSMLGRGNYTQGSSYKRRPVNIGSRVWIGANCFVKCGITIGDNVVIGACSNVVSDIPANAQYIGSVARPYFQVMRDFVTTTARKQSH
jgi:galactoside O-acetyltransferase